MKDHRAGGRVADAALDMLELTGTDLADVTLMMVTDNDYRVPDTGNLMVIIHLEPYADTDLWLGYSSTEHLLVYRVQLPSPGGPELAPDDL